MKRSKNYYILLGVFIILLDLGCNINTKPKSEELYVFENANIIQIDEEQVLENYSVLIKDGEIARIEASSSFKNPKGATIINASKKYLIPGLSDMHVHLVGDAWNIMYPPEKKFTSEELDYNDILFPFIANGITTINVMSSFPEHITIRDSIKEGELLGPEMILSRIVDGAGKAWPPPISTWVNNKEEAKNAVIAANAAGYDRIKAYSFLDKESYDTIIQTAKDLNMPVDGHIPMSTSVEYVAKSGQGMIAHAEEILKFVNDFSEGEISSLSNILVENNVWLTATLTTTQNLVQLFDDPEFELNKPGTEFNHPQGRDIWNYIYENMYKPIPQTHREFIENGLSEFQIPFVKTFHEKGGNLLAGTDALIPPTLIGSSLHDELELFVKAGLSPFETLKTATLNADEFLGREKQTIQPGQVANLILLDKNPLEDISNTREIAGVFTQKEWISKNQIDKRMAEIATTYVELKDSKSK